MLVWVADRLLYSWVDDVVDVLSVECLLYTDCESRRYDSRVYTVARGEAREVRDGLHLGRLV